MPVFYSDGTSTAWADSGTPAPPAGDTITIVAGEIRMYKDATGGELSLRKGLSGNNIRYLAFKYRVGASATIFGDHTLVHAWTDNFVGDLMQVHAFPVTGDSTKYDLRLYDQTRGAGSTRAGALSKGTTYLIEIEINDTGGTIRVDGTIITTLTGSSFAGKNIGIFALGNFYSGSHTGEQFFDDITADPTRTVPGTAHTLTRTDTAAATEAFAYERIVSHGQLTNGSSSQSYSSDRKLANQQLANASGWLKSAAARIWSTGAPFAARYIVYEDNAGEPGALYAYSDDLTITNTTEQLVEGFTFSGDQRKPITFNAYYWIGVHYDYPGAAVLISRNNTAGLVRSNNNGFAANTAPTDPFGATGTTAGKLDTFIRTTNIDPAIGGGEPDPEYPTIPTTWASTVAAWVYPGPPAELADEEYSDGRVIHTLKPEYLRLQDTGEVITTTEAIGGQNGYTIANAADVKANSVYQYITLAGTGTGLTAMEADSAKRSAGITHIVNLVNTTDFTGVELDIEGFGAWTTANWTFYKQFLIDLKTALGTKKLAICAPPISNSTEQGYYPFTYEEAAPLVDELIIMAYDYMYDYGGGSAVAPTAWVQAIIAWANTKIGSLAKVTMGINSYGYQAAPGGYSITILTKDQAETKTGYTAAATMDPDSFERSWENGGIHYRFVDTDGLNYKRAIIEEAGITKVSVWHLGGNEWFGGTEQTIVAGINHTHSAADTATATDTATPQLNPPAWAGLQETFAAQPSGAVWDLWGTAPSITYANGRLIMKNQPGTAQYHGLTTLGTYDFTGRHASIRIHSMPTIAAGDTSVAGTMISLEIAEANRYLWQHDWSGLTTHKVDAGVYTQIGAALPYNASRHRYLRIREAAGTVYYEWSTDGWIWTTHSTTPASVAVTAMKIAILAGQWNTANATNQYTWELDDLNITPTIQPYSAPTSRELHVRTNSSLYTYANSLGAGIKKDRFLWAASQGSFSYFAEDYANQAAELDALLDAAETAGKSATFVIYSIPHRDNGEFSVGGSATPAAYRAYIDSVAAIIGTRQAIISLESDALAGIGTLNAQQQQERKDMLAYAIVILKQNCPGVKLYVDAGHPAYGGTAAQMAGLLRDVGIQNADGITLNASNYYEDAAIETRANAILDLLTDLKGGKLGYIYDTSRNGPFNTGLPTYYANPAGRTLGQLPEYGGLTPERKHGYMWIKTPGESDGQNAYTVDGVNKTAPTPGVFWPVYMWNDAVGENINPPGGATDPTDTDWVELTSGMLQREPAITAVPETDPATDFTRTDADTAASAEASTRQAATSKTDASTATDSVQIIVGRTITIADAATSSEAATRQPGAAKADTATATDSPRRTISPRKTDIATATEASTRTPGKTAADTATVTDAITLARAIQHAVADSVIVTDEYQGDHSSGGNVQETDTVTIQDAIAIALTSTAADTISTADAQAQQVELGRSENLTAIDGPNVVPDSDFNDPNWPSAFWAPTIIAQDTSLDPTGGIDGSPAATFITDAQASNVGIKQVTPPDGTGVPGGRYRAVLMSRASAAGTLDIGIYTRIGTTTMYLATDDTTWQSSYSSKQLPVGTDWTEVVREFTLPAGALKVYWGDIKRGGSGTQINKRFWIDNARIYYLGPEKEISTPADDATAASDDASTAADYDRTAADSQAASDAHTKAISSGKADTANAIDSLARAIATIRADQAAAADQIDKTAGIREDDTATATDSSTRQGQPRPADTISAADSTTKRIEATKADIAEAEDLISKTLAFIAAEQLEIIDSAGNATGKGPADEITTTDTITNLIEIYLADEVTATDETERQWIRRISNDIEAISARANQTRSARIKARSRR